MPLTDAQAVLLSNDALVKGLVENDPRRIQLAGLLPFFPVPGNRLAVPRVTSANFGTAVWDTGGLALSDTPAVPTNPNASYPLKLLVTAFKNNATAEETMSDVVDQAEVQVLAAVKRLLYQFFTAFNTGDSSANPQEIDGLRRLVTSGQTITARGGSGGIPSLAELDQLVSLIKSAGGLPSALYTNRKGFEAIRRAHWRQGIAPDFVELPFAPALPSVSSRCMAFDGIPVLVDDNVPSNETASNLTSIYALVLGKDGLYGIVPSDFTSEMIRVAKVLVDGKAQESYVVFWPVGLALESETGIARLQMVG